MKNLIEYIASVIFIAILTIISVLIFTILVGVLVKGSTPINENASQVINQE